MTSHPGREYLARARPLPDGTFAVQALADHLAGVAERAAAFAEPFGAADWARVAALWHDIGKYHPDFQSYIRKATGFDPDAHLETAPGRVDHSTLGAIHAQGRLNLPGRPLGRLLAYVIAGHHAGLPDWNSAEEGGRALHPRLLLNAARMDAALAQPIPEGVRNPPAPTSRPPGGMDGLALWARMIFSCVVDADFLDTEKFMHPEQAALRSGYPSLAELRGRFDAYMARKLASAPPSPVNRVRADVLRHCRERAMDEPGIFSLTVPTGGGKTLSSLAFGLDHAVTRGKTRVIYVIPYTSIIEQTADVFRDALGADAVVEHHSALDPERETRESRLASENWDAPVVVTTAVQFFESLFAARTGAARKLHNIAGSVVVLDEAQMLPPAFLTPIVDVVRRLAADYGATMVLCTATQPALHEQHTDVYFRGLPDVREIIPDPAALHDTLRRVRVEIPADLRAPRSWDDIAADVSLHPRVLCIVSRRDDCRELYRRLPAGSIHLSALMCGEHRSRALREIKRRLGAGEEVRVASTQLVEAGVDVDFPVVFRALAGLDSLAQAAGRCNREGSLRDAAGEPALGRVVVFVPPRPAPVGLLRIAEEGGRRMLEQAASDPLAPERFRDYFGDLYWKFGKRLDERRILDHLRPDRDLGIRFRTAAREFQLIDDASLPVIVRYTPPPDPGAPPIDGIDALLDRLRSAPPDRQIQRKLQRFIVNIPLPLHQRLLRDSRIEELHPGLFVQSDNSLYHPELGLLARDDAEPAPPPR